ncbi:MAG: hypothetical protein JWN88_889, partial [Frankiales bacterium]|nr:hypothetical protein [Frankiales bacterium]
PSGSALAVRVWPAGPGTLAGLALGPVSGPALAPVLGPLLGAVAARPGPVPAAVPSLGSPPPLPVGTARPVRSAARQVQASRKALPVSPHRGHATRALAATAATLRTDLAADRADHVEKKATADHAEKKATADHVEKKARAAEAAGTKA